VRKKGQQRVYARAPNIKLQHRFNSGASQTPYTNGGRGITFNACFLQSLLQQAPFSILSWDALFPKSDLPLIYA
jgi:hypothetical protein